MSSVELVKIENLKIHVKNHDLLDETPILDIKPYLAYADSFPEASLGWVQASAYQVTLSDEAQLQINFLEANNVIELRPFLLQQLEYEPTNAKKKRVKPDDYSYFIIAYRTWRARFEVQNSHVVILEIFSGYSDQELQDESDPYNDKLIHRNFTDEYSKF